MNWIAREIPIDRARDLLAYDPQTGVLTWRVARSGTAQAGAVAGSLNKGSGYICVYIDNIGYKAHRLIWALVTGEQPAGEIDHRNLCRSDNRWANLRDATEQQQRGNRRAYSNNTSGIKGVHWCKASQKWIASVGDNGRRKTLGRFDTKEAAAAAYAGAALRIWGEFART